MPRSLIRGSQVKDESITHLDLARDSVITEKIKDGNVTCPKLEPGICDRLLSSSSPIARVKLTEDILPHQDFTLPGGIYYDVSTFVERVLICRNGQILYNGIIEPNDDKEPTEVWPGTSNNKVKFDMLLRRGETITVIIL